MLHWALAGWARNGFIFLSHDLDLLWIVGGVWLILWMEKYFDADGLELLLKMLKTLKALSIKAGGYIVSYGT